MLGKDSKDRYQSHKAPKVQRQADLRPFEETQAHYSHQVVLEVRWELDLGSTENVPDTTEVQPDLPRLFEYLFLTSIFDWCITEAGLKYRKTPSSQK